MKSNERKERLVQYAGFWRRLIAIFLDTMIVFYPLIQLLSINVSNFGSLFVLSFIFQSLPFIYNICLLGICGQTLGMMVVRVRVEKLNQEKIKWKEAFLRYAVNVFVAILFLLMEYFYFSGVDEALLVGKNYSQFFLEFRNSNSTFNLISKIIASFSWIWTFSEVAVLLMNEKKRAIHDYIAGTVVVNVSK
jgi:uncharacterized RDD family membrane protein YckC